MNMRLCVTAITSVSLALAVLPARTDSADRPPVVRDRAGQVRNAIELAPAQAPPTAVADIFTRGSQGDGYWVDADGTRHDGLAPSVSPVLAPSERAPTLPASALTAPPPLASVTIDRMTTANIYSTSYTPYREFRMLGSAATYYLSDHTTWTSGAGSFTNAYATFDHVEVAGDTLRFFLIPEADSLLYSQTDYDSGDHSSQGSLVLSGPLVLEAVAGATTAVLRGSARIRDNAMTWYGEPAFNFFTSIPGSIVPFTNTYTNGSGRWAMDTFDHPFSYVASGQVDFAHPLSTPPLVELTIRGPRQIPAASSTQFGAVARFAGEVYRDVRNRALWSVSPSLLANVNAGLLTVPSITTPRADLVLSATYQAASGAPRSASIPVACVAAIFAPQPDAWPMYQADIGHTGYRPLTLSTGMFMPLWQRTVGSGLALNPVSAGDGMVFCSLIGYFPPASIQQVFALEAYTGATLWSTGYGSVYSVNPPSYSYGNVYVQSGNHSTDTYLHAIDAASGTPIFDAPHEAQWERYYAPTISDGKVYVDGGYYGGMYRFDAFSGAQNWFNGALPQYDEWTPALDDSNAYAYLGEYSPGLYAVSRATGVLRFSIMDPGFQWNGWSMDGTAVVCGNGDIIAVQAGRLLCFNVPRHQLAWQVARAFSGQPSFAHGSIYAIDGGKLVAIDEATHADLWSWTPPTGSLVGTLVVTDSHVFGSTSGTTYAVSLASHASEWVYPAGGALALGNKALYIATSGGRLHAIDVADHPVATTLMRFDGRGLEDGVHLFWRFAEPGEVATVDMQRAATTAGPWSSLTVEESWDGEVSTALDRDVRPGQTYWYRLSVGFTDGTHGDLAPVQVTAAGQMAVNGLKILGPLPAAGAVAIEYSVASRGNASLTVFDVGGRVVEWLARGPLEPGEHMARWASAASARAGIYFVRLESPGYRETKRVVLAR